VAIREPLLQSAFEPLVRTGTRLSAGLLELDLSSKRPGGTIERCISTAWQRSPEAAITPSFRPRRGVGSSKTPASQYRGTRSTSNTSSLTSTTRSLPRDVASAVYLVAVSRRRSSACSDDPVSAARTWVGTAVDVRIHGVSGRVSGA
jgi:hypothetical protein